MRNILARGRIELLAVLLGITCSLGIDDIKIEKKEIDLTNKKNSI